MLDISKPLPKAVTPADVESFITVMQIAESQGLEITPESKEKARELLKPIFAEEIMNLINQAKSGKTRNGIDVAGRIGLKISRMMSLDDSYSYEEAGWSMELLTKLYEEDIRNRVTKFTTARDVHKSKASLLHYWLDVIKKGLANAAEIELEFDFINEDMIKVWEEEINEKVPVEA